MRVLVKQARLDPVIYEVDNHLMLDACVNKQLGTMNWLLEFTDGEPRANLMDKTTGNMLGYVLLLDGRFRFPESEEQSCFLEGEDQI